MRAHVFSRKRLSGAAFDVVLPLGRFHSPSTAPRVVVALLVPLAAGDVVRVVVRDPVRLRVDASVARAANARDAGGTGTGTPTRAGTSTTPTRDEEEAVRAKSARARPSARDARDMDAASRRVRRTDRSVPGGASRANQSRNSLKDVI